MVADLRQDAIGALPTQTLWMDTAEHTLLRKLEWYRRGGEVSDRQWRDIRSIVALQGDKLNRETLSRWASILGVSDLLARCLDDSAQIVITPRRSSGACGGGTPNPRWS